MAALRAYLFSAKDPDYLFLSCVFQGACCTESLRLLYAESILVLLLLLLLSSLSFLTVDVVSNLSFNFLLLPIFHSLQLPCKNIEFAFPPESCTFEAVPLAILLSFFTWAFVLHSFFYIPMDVRYHESDRLPQKICFYLPVQNLIEKFVLLCLPHFCTQSIVHHTEI